MKTACPLCAAPLDTPYVMLGAKIVCPVCDRPVVPRTTSETVILNTGYEITFHDFRRLCSDPAYRPSVLPHLRHWFDCDVPLSGDSFLIAASDGSNVLPLTIHLKIQADPGKQYTLYQTAMSLWR